MQRALTTVFETPFPGSVVMNIPPALLEARRNTILRGLDASAFDHLVRRAALVDIPRGKVLGRPMRPMAHIWFPISGAAAIATRMPARRWAILEIVGPEGALLPPPPLGAPGLPAIDAHVVWLVPGQALRLPVDRVVAEPEAVGRLSAFARLLVAELLREVLCVGHHALEARAARWLLEFQERSGPTFFLTHDALADVLNTGRPTATKIMRGFSDAAWVTYHRGKVEILDRTALRQACCGCHRVGEAMRVEYAARLAVRG
jgi:CRP-like cAMP-binding protein